jgi:hypothetical protein
VQTTAAGLTRLLFQASLLVSQPVGQAAVIDAVKGVAAAAAADA